ncbi:MAG: inorganic diphosphatase [Myxococcota bacterium]
MAHPWHDLPNYAETAHEWFNVVIEIPRGSRVKYELDKPTGMLRVDRILYSSVHYPANYGFAPRSYCPDGDPLDVLVLGTEPVQPLCIMQARAIGVIAMEDEGKEDSKVIAVHINDPAVRDYTDIEQLPRHTFAEIEGFFEDYKKLEHKKVVVEQVQGAAHALEAVKASFELYRRRENELRGW